MAITWKDVPAEKAAHEEGSMTQTGVTAEMRDRINALAFLFERFGRYEDETEAAYRDRIVDIYECDREIWQRRYAIFQSLADAKRLLEQDTRIDGAAVALGQVNAALDNIMYAKDDRGIPWLTVYSPSVK